MRDLNFFQPYIEDKKFKLEKESIFRLFIIVFIGLITLFGVWNQVRIVRLDRELARLKEGVERMVADEDVKKLLDKQKKINEIRKNIGKISKEDEKINEYDLINEELLAIIDSKLPKNLSITSISGDIYDIEIVGTAGKKDSIVKFEEKLQDTDILDTFVSNISLVDKKYNFSLNIKLKEEEENGNDGAD